jgi:hypothetical protein
MTARRIGQRWITAALLAMTALATVVLVAAAGANLAGSTFEGNDGNLIVNTAGNKDWDNAPALAVGVDLPTGSNDNSLGQGSKENDTIVSVVDGSIPNSKADLARFAVATEKIGSVNFLYLAWSRENLSGTVNFDFEINQVAQPNMTTLGSKTLIRTTGDLLLNYAFQGGSTTVGVITRYVWNGSSWGTGSVLDSAQAEAATNGSPVLENLGGNPGVLRPAQAFGEAAINMQAAGLFPPGVCSHFGSAYVKSRSSTAFNSELKDFIAPIPVNINNCGGITIIKHTNPGGLDQAFGYTTTGGLSPATFSLNDAGVDTQNYANVLAGTYTVSEDADPSGFAFASLTCVGGANTTTLGRVATINLNAGESVTCTYINDQQFGALKVSKSSIKGAAPLAGAVFSVTGPNSFSTTLTTLADGTACVDHLPFGSYSVTETAAPAGYAIDDPSAHIISVIANEDCSVAAVDFAATDTPLTDIAASANSQATGLGATNSDVSCVDENGNPVGNSPQGPAEDPAVAAVGLAPGTYVCTIVVDP